MLRVLVLSAEDNVGVVVKGAAPGDSLACATGGEIVCLDAIPPGHKVAVTEIHRGAKVLKFGVHTHNLASDYTPTLAETGQ